MSVNTVKERMASDGAYSIPGRRHGGKKLHNENIKSTLSRENLKWLSDMFQVTGSNGRDLY